MNKLSIERRAQVVKLLCKGNTLRGIQDATGTDAHTAMWMMVDYGHAALAFHDKHVRDLKCVHIECDEMHSYVLARECNLTPALRGTPGYGSYYTWAAIDSQTKLIPAWHIGRREMPDANAFIGNLARKTVGRIQISTDGFQAYLPAINEHFGDEVDYARLLKIFNKAAEKMTMKQWIERPDNVKPKLVATKKVPVLGEPNMDLVGTAIVERMHSTVRMSLRRYMQGTHGQSRKLENHIAMTGLFYVVYNFCRYHITLRCTPAMEAGLTDHIWEVEELIEHLDRV